MSEANKETASVPEPPAIAEQPVAGQDLAETTLGDVEKSASMAEKSAAAASHAIPAATIPLPLPPAQATDDHTDVSATTQASGLPIDDDGDLIEKEWVTKAKQIVERNRNDPHKQSEELTVFKAGYMKKRYGKTIKLNQ